MRIFCLAACLAACLPLSATAEVLALPDYLTFQLQARSSSGLGYNLPIDASISDATVDLNDAGQVAMRVTVLTNIPGDVFSRHIFVGEGGSGFVVSEGPVGSQTSDPRVSPDGLVWFAANFQGGGAQAGIYRYNPNDISTVLVTGLPSGSQSYKSPRGNAAGQIGYLAGFTNGQAWVSFSGGGVQTHAVERTRDSGSPYGVLFAPMMDEHQLIAGKVALAGSGFQQIRTVDNHGTAVVLAVTTAESGQSPFSGFDDIVAIAPSSGQVAFIANLAAGGRGVYRYDGPGTIVEIARTGTQGLGSIESFGAAINNNGLVAFRGVDTNGKQAIFVGDDTDLRRVIGRGDSIMTDLGLGQIDQQTPAASAFTGGVAINAAGDIAFSPALTPAGNNQIEWGTGVYIARAGAQQVFANGFEGN